MKMATTPPSHQSVVVRGYATGCDRWGTKLGPTESHKKCVSVFAKHGLFVSLCLLGVSSFYASCVFECAPRGMGGCFCVVCPLYERLLCVAICRIKASYSLQSRHALWGCLHVLMVRQRQTHRRLYDSAAKTLTISYVKVVIWARVAWKLNLND